MSTPLKNRKIAILATNGFEQAELDGPRKALTDAGAEVVIVAPDKGSIQGMHHLEAGESVKVDATLDEVEPADFDALMLPGGLANPDELRANRGAIDFIRAFAAESKPIAAICHAPWLLIEAGLVKGRRLTSWPAIRSDIRNAGGEWLDEKVVCDKGIVTSRSPADIPAFNEKMIGLFA